MLTPNQAEKAIASPICSYCGNEMPKVLHTKSFVGEPDRWQATCNMCGARGPVLMDRQKAIAVTQWGLEMTDVQRSICMKLVVDNVACATS